MNSNRVTLADLPLGKAVASIEGVVENIIRHGDLLRLKVWREVNSQWNQVAKKELRKRCIIRLCSNNLQRCGVHLCIEGGNASLVCTPCFCDHHPGQLAVLRRNGDPYTAQDPSSTIQRLLNVIKNSRSNEFPCDSFLLSCARLSSPFTKHVLTSIRHQVKSLKLILYNFFQVRSSNFEKNEVMLQLEALLLNLTTLERLNLRAEFPKSWQQQIQEYDRSPSTQFLNYGSAQYQERQKIILPSIKYFSYSGLVPQKVIMGIQEASVNLKVIREIESSSEYLRKLESNYVCPLNECETQLLENLAGRYKSTLNLVNVTLDLENILHEDKHHGLKLTIEILQNNSHSVKYVELFSSTNFADIKLPAMKNVKLLQLKSAEFGDLPGNILCMNISPPYRENNENELDIHKCCAIQFKFPALKLLCLPNDFDFSNSNFEKLLGFKFQAESIVDVSETFQCVQAIKVEEDRFQLLEGVRRNQVRALFPNASLQIVDRRELATDMFVLQ